MLKMLTSPKGFGAAALTALTLAAATTTADARPRHYHRHHNNNGAAVAAALIGGLAIAAIASQHRHRDCWTERRVVVDRYGYRYVRPVRVCG